MESTDLLFAVLGPVLAGIFATAGYGAIAVTPADFKKTRVCFVAAAICLGGIPMVWGFTTIHPIWARLLITALFGAVAVSGLTEGLRWVTGREHKADPAAVVAQTPIPIPLNPEFELVYGPYQPEEVRMMTLALGDLRSIFDQQAAPTVDIVKQLTDNWLAQYHGGAEKYSHRIGDALNRVYAARSAMENYAGKNRRFHYELQPVYEDNSDATGQMIGSLTAAADNILAVNAAPNIDANRILSKDIGRVQITNSLYENWVSRVIQRAETKIRRLRDYKFSG